MPSSGRESRKPAGRLFLIGGGEDRTARGEVLSTFVARAGGKRARILVCGAALDEPKKTLREYTKVFEELGAEVIAEEFPDRNAGENQELVDALDRCTAVFMTGGDQLQATTRMAGTTFSEAVNQMMQKGRLLIAGTSAGAAAVGSVMTIAGPDDGSVRRSDVELAPGLGYWNHVLVDTHFNERGRVSRLMVVFAQNPAVLGIGIDENTAVDITMDGQLRVLGKGAVIVFDGRVTHTNAAEAAADEILAVTDATVHVLAPDYCFDLTAMRPVLPGETRPLPPPHRAD